MKISIKEIRVCKNSSNYFREVLRIVHFTVTGGNEAGVDLFLIQPFLLYYVNHVFLMLQCVTSVFLVMISMTKGKRFVSKQGQPQPHVHSKATLLSPQL